MRRYYQSLWFRLIFGLILGSLVAVLAASFFLYIRFKHASVEYRERTLQGEANLIGELFRMSPRHRIRLPNSDASYYQDGTGEYAVLWRDEILAAGSPGVTHALHPIDPAVRRDFFTIPQPEGKAALYGISLRIKGSSPQAWVQVVFRDERIMADSVLEEFMQDIAWIWLPFVGMLLVINLFVIRIGLRPLARASAQASAIGPAAVSARLSEVGMPREVLTFVRAINSALDRLERGYKEQQAFIADAAHELRTPVTIMTTHMDVLPNFQGKAALKEELGALKRLVSQLLDNARIDAMRITPFDYVDLNALAVDIASYLAPYAIARGKKIDVYQSEQPALVNGAYDYLFRALRNLVENGIEHTPPGTAVYIGIQNPATLIVADCGPGIPKGQRQAIFQRFWQGKRDRGGGAGLGMEIISRTIAAHNAVIQVGDRRGGGALFRITFPAFDERLLPAAHISAVPRQWPAGSLPPSYPAGAKSA